MIYTGLTKSKVNPHNSPSALDAQDVHRHLQHYNEPGLIQAITYRLVDSMPVSLRAEWIQLLQIDQATKRNTKVQEYIDRGLGDCVLSLPAVANIVEKCLNKHNGTRYDMLAWVIMPNHVHVLIRTREGYTLAGIVHGWKSCSARLMNIELGRQGARWHRDYYDRYIRDERHLERAVIYIHQNPVKASLVADCKDWVYSSARFVETEEMTLGVTGVDKDERYR
jgi:putative transposase